MQRGGPGGHLVGPRGEGAGVARFPGTFPRGGRLAQPAPLPSASGLAGAGAASESREGRGGRRGEGGLLAHRLASAPGGKLDSLNGRPAERCGARSEAGAGRGRGGKRGGQSLNGGGAAGGGAETLAGHWPAWVSSPPYPCQVPGRAAVPRPLPLGQGSPRGPLETCGLHPLGERLEGLPLPPQPLSKDGGGGAYPAWSTAALGL